MPARARWPGTAIRCRPRRWRRSSAAMLLDHVGQPGAAQRLRAGIAAALAHTETRTGDLGGRASTALFTDAVIRAMVAAEA